MTDQTAAPAAALRQPAPTSRLRRLVELGVVVMLGFVAAHFVWLMIVPASRLPAPDAGLQSTATATRKPAEKLDLGILTRFDPFNRSLAAPVTESAEAAPETSLDLKLFGVRLSDDPAHSSAIIQTGGKDQSVYRPGDEILSGVRLDRVYDNRVSLSRAGVIETLSLDDGSGPILGGKAPSKAAPAGPTTAASDLKSVLRQVRLVPRREGQRITGWQIDTDGSPAGAAALKSYGLEPGDVLASLNGETLGSAEDLTDALSEIDRTGSIRLEIERAGKRIPLTLSSESNPA
ncbi:type II secretion system protein N [Pseudokordiimonas caeni]|uniref:type II secretion system protein N n=1 Tax=Pseudokordiimonas caeni TaxID=2997908 RepID=UPI002810B6A8|nr:type II secretion system protein N [Pseudokordiimonas caeni]